MEHQITPKFNSPIRDYNYTWTLHTCKKIPQTLQVLRKIQSWLELILREKFS